MTGWLLALASWWAPPDHGVELRRDRDESVYCGGVLLSPTLALTARHCLTPVGGKNFSVTHAGRHARPVRVKVPFDDDRYFPLFDIALVVLDRPVATPEYAPPKFGGTEDLSAGADLEVNAVHTAQFQRSWAGDHLFGVFTAINSDEDAPCHGDSGGGVYATVAGERVLVGLVAGTADLFGLAPRDCRASTLVYTEVAVFRDWIGRGGEGSLPHAAPRDQSTRCATVPPEDPEWLAIQRAIYKVARTDGDPTLFLDCKRAEARLQAVSN